MTDPDCGLSPTALDLFCGVGGLSLGLILAGFRLIGACDSDRIALDAHRANFHGVPVHRCDLFLSYGAEIREALGISDSVIDLLAGGPPCQGFSVGGRRAMIDPRNDGIMAFARLVGELRPRFFLMENVRGLLFKDHARLRERFAVYLVAAGYQLQPFKLLNASDYGVPQRRARAFILGCLTGEMLPEYPEPSGIARPSVRDAISDLMRIRETPKRFTDDTYRGCLGKPSDYAAKLRVIPDGGGDIALTGCLLTNHTGGIIERFKTTPPGGMEPISRFFRLAWEGVSPTLRAGTGPEHGSHTAPRPIHPDRHRCITVREAARLHSFPDWFSFHASRWHGFRQIGNSVPPLLAKAVAGKVAEVSHATPLRRAGRSIR